MKHYCKSIEERDSCAFYLDMKSKAERLEKLLLHVRSELEAMEIELEVGLKEVA